MTLEMDLNLQGHLVTCLTASISYIRTEKAFVAVWIWFVALRKWLHLEGSMWKCSHRSHALLYGSPRVELVGWIYDELKEKGASVHRMDVYIDGVEGLALYTFVIS